MAVKRIKLNDRDARLLSENHVSWNRGATFWEIQEGAEVYAAEGRVFEQFTRHPHDKILSLGAFSYVVEASRNFLFADIGRYCSIARGTHIVNGNHPIASVTTNPYHFSKFYQQHLPDDLKYTGPEKEFSRGYGRVKIGNDVWIGGHCIIRSGVSIGDGSVLASGSVIVKDVPPYSIVGGNPARLIRERFPREIIDRFLDLEFWSYDPRGFRDIDMFDIEKFLDTMEQRKAEERLSAFRPKRLSFQGGKVVEL